MPRGANSIAAYLKAITGQDYTAKDFRTWSGTVLAVTALRELGDAPSQTGARKHVLQAMDAVAGVLGNTRAVCRKSYVHPAIVDAYMDEGLERACRPPRPPRAVPGLRADELATLNLLRRWYAARERRAA